MLHPPLFRTPPLVTPKFPHVPLGVIAIVVLGWSLRTPNLGEGEALVGRSGTVRKSVGDFLWALHSNFSSFGLWATKSEGVGLIVRATSFQDFQPVSV